MSRPKKSDAKPLPERGCHNCRHWKEETEPGDDVRNGTCRRFPPTVLYDAEDGSFSLWAYTAADDWCGEHGAKLQ